VDASAKGHWDDAIISLPPFIRMSRPCPLAVSLTTPGGHWGLQRLQQLPCRISLPLGCFANQFTAFNPTFSTAVNKSR
jgi:hypothetical protein